MNAEDENLSDETESEDEDYQPTAQTEVVSEEEEDGDPEGKTEKDKKKRKRKKKIGRKSFKRRRNGGNNEDSEDSDDQEGDADFIIDPKDLEDDDVPEEAEDPEILAAREKVEKARTDVLWADFLTSVETSKSKKKDDNTTTEVTKVYDFAGERIEVKEKVRVDQTKNPGLKSSSTNGTSKSIGSSSSGIISNSVSVDSSPETPSPSSGPPRLKISFLSGDPADIGLAGDKKTSAKEGLANVLNALNARSKKLGTLEKSKIDWENYKREQNIQEELANHNRSKNGYMDKQEFLQRTDLRQFEIEKDARTKKRRNV